MVRKTKKANEDNYKRFQEFVALTTDGFIYLHCRQPVDLSLPIKEQIDQFYAHTYVEECNAAMAEIYGLKSPEEMIGKLYKTINEGQYDEHQKVVSRFMKNGYRLKSEEYLHDYGNGTYRYFLVHAFGIVEDGYFLGLWGTRRDITEKKKTELVIKTRESLFSNLLEYSPMGVVFVNPDSSLQSVNPALCKLLGHKKEELIGQDYKDYTHPDDAEAELNQLRNAINQGLPSIYVEKRFIHKNGNIIWTRVGVALIYNEDQILRHAVAMIVDVTDRHLALRSLKESESLLKGVLKAMPDLKFRISLDGVFLDYYPSENEVDLLVSPELFLLKKVDEVLPMHIAIGVKANMLKAQATGEVQIFEYALTVNDHLGYYEARISALNKQEFIIVIRNISERKKAQTGLQEKIQELDVKNRQLQKYIDSNLQLENFAYIASHDLREPLRTMSTFAQLLHRRHGDKLDDQGKEYIEFINKGAANLNQLIEDLLTYSRVNTGDQTKSLLDVDLLLEEVKKGLSKTIQETGAVFYTRNLPEKIMANGTKMKQLFQNLIANAIKFKQADLSPYIEISARDTGTHWQFKVADNGIGIKPEFQETIFLLFKKLHGMGDYEGTGLGLAICKKVVEQHQGEIWVESNPGKGATFYFTLKK